MTSPPLHNPDLGSNLNTQGLREVEALHEIKARLRAEEIDTPLVADVHFSAEVALAVARVADKVRINPGNFAPVHEDACRKFAELIEICREEAFLRVPHNSCATA